jgi:hypothetical protein
MYSLHCQITVRSMQVADVLDAKYRFAYTSEKRLLVELDEEEFAIDVYKDVSSRSVSVCLGNIPVDLPLLYL